MRFMTHGSAADRSTSSSVRVASRPSHRRARRPRVQLRRHGLPSLRRATCPSRPAQLGAASESQVLFGDRELDRLRASMDAADVEGERCRRWVGTPGRAPRIRTHVDTASGGGGSALSLRDDLRSPDLLGMPIELEVVAFPQEGILTDPQREADWRAVVEMGCDAVNCIPTTRPATRQKFARCMCFSLARPRPQG